MRPFTPEDAPVLRRWSVAPEEFLRVEDLLAAAEVPGTLTFVALDAEGLIVAVLQTAPEGSERVAMRSVALLVHPGARRAGFGRATVFAALDEPCYAGSMLFAAIDCQNGVSLRCFAACGFVADGGAVAKGYPEFVRRVPARTGRRDTDGGGEAGLSCVAGEPRWSFGMRRRGSPGCRDTAERSRWSLATAAMSHLVISTQHQPRQLREDAAAEHGLPA